MAVPMCEHCGHGLSSCYCINYKTVISSDPNFEKEPAPYDEIATPAHYTYSSIEPIYVIEEWALPHHLACVIKYLARYQHKGSADKDLRKARWYLDRYISLRGKSEKGTK